MILVDANILIFERIREELRAGKTTMAAVDTGYDRALVTIVDANVTTLIAAAVLAAGTVGVAGATGVDADAVGVFPHRFRALGMAQAGLHCQEGTPEQLRAAVPARRRLPF